MAKRANLFICLFIYLFILTLIFKSFQSYKKVAKIVHKVSVYFVSNSKTNTSQINETFGLRAVSLTCLVYTINVSVTELEAKYSPLWFAILFFFYSVGTGPFGNLNLWNELMVKENSEVSFTSATRYATCYLHNISGYPQFQTHCWIAFLGSLYLSNYVNSRPAFNSWYETFSNNFVLHLHWQLAIFKMVITPSVWVLE